MRRYSIISRILLILTVTTFTLAAPVSAQEKRQALEDVTTVLGKRGGEQGLEDILLETVFQSHLMKGDLGHVPPQEGVHLQNPAPPPEVPTPNPAEARVQEAHVPATPNPTGVDVPPQPQGAALPP